MFVIIIAQLIPDVNFVMNISYILGINDVHTINSIAELSPYGISLTLTNNPILFDMTVNLINALPSAGFTLIKLAFYMVITVILNYIVFIRSDIS
jgi:ABC-type transport system involved in multi-copper enzyme maturation permease subunit